MTGAALPRWAAAECVCQWLTSTREPPTSLIHAFLTSDHHRGFIVSLGIASTPGREKGLKLESLISPHCSFPADFPSIRPTTSQQVQKNHLPKQVKYLKERHSQPPPMSILSFLLSNRPRTLAWSWLGLTASLAARCGQGFSSCQQDLRTSSDERVWGSARSSCLMSRRPTSWLYF